MHIFKLFFYYLIFLSIIFSKGNIKFSANILENRIENDVEKRFFKDQVVVKKETMVLYANEAIHIPSLGQVILNKDVYMYDHADSLKCNQLILYDKDFKEFTANGDIQYFKEESIISSQNLHYIESLNGDTINLNLYDQVYIQSPNRQVFGDTLHINYIDSILQNINILSNARVINSNYMKFKQEGPLQPIEDIMNSKKMDIYFTDGDLSQMIMEGMVTTDFNVIEDSLVTGHSTSSGDSIQIILEKNSINRMQMFGGVRGLYKPEKNNSQIDSTVIYSANHIDYQIDNQISYLYDNAVVNYDMNILKAGEIFVDWNTNMLEATVQDSIVPSVNGFGQAPLYGDKMIFDLIENKGKIIKGATEFNDSYYLGKLITKQENESYYINNSLYTTCNLDEPHYHLHSNKMKMIPNDRIIAKPMILYVQDLPIFYMPFAVLPNQNGNRVSGWIMPSFGNTNKRGTYLEDLGYYHVINDYSDYTFLFDIQDKYGIKTHHNYRYKVNSGQSWYNYYINGYLKINNKYLLQSDDNDISNIFNDNSREMKNIYWNHKQNFDPTQKIYINYSYRSDLDPLEIQLNKRLDQTQETDLSYTKQWARNTLSIGFDSYKNLAISIPKTLNEINSYKWIDGPAINFDLPSRKIFGNGDRWYNNIYTSYDFKYNYGKEYYIKQSCIDNDQNNECDISQSDTEDQSSNYYIWSSSDSTNIVKGAATNKIAIRMPSTIGFLTISPEINLKEEWAFEYQKYNILTNSYDFYSDFNRRLFWDVHLDLSTKIYGIIPINLGSLKTIRHSIAPKIEFTYYPNLMNDYENQYDTYTINDNSFAYDILSSSLSPLNTKSQKIRFSIDNFFEGKKYDGDGNISKIQLLQYDIGFNYIDNETSNKNFSDIDSRISFKKPRGGELFYIHLKHNMYEKDSDELLIKKGKLPRFELLTFKMSSNFTLKGEVLSSNNNDAIANDDNTQYNSLLYMDQQIPELGDHELWRSDLGVSIKGEYTDENKEWDFQYFNLDSYNTIHLTKNWLLTYAAGFNLLDMKINSQSIKFYRELHCWELMFTWWPDGINKGFQLSINVMHPDLKDIRVRSSSANQKF